ncbi:hypothetical protein KKD37_01685 [Patescibacteria group bacterium]|nr:hypothetical protein [Patescibacteria group bacterium]
MTEFDIDPRSSEGEMAIKQLKYEQANPNRLPLSVRPVAHQDTDSAVRTLLRPEADNNLAPVVVRTTSYTTFKSDHR